VKRFVHVSTEAVLANGKPIVRADQTRVLPAKPMGAYPITKAVASRGSSTTPSGAFVRAAS
jgi:hypothetical protein